ncbi:HbrB-like-domain-containing protein [Phyllosticta citriasiana]|uniref:HbrB-like-domain-containing protein n=1 Tax=Phyllosticta citriasiana TaxID=595635 RepID=UPI0030FDCE18
MTTSSPRSQLASSPPSPSSRPHGPVATASHAYAPAYDGDSSDSDASRRTVSVVRNHLQQPPPLHHYHSAITVSPSLSHAAASNVSKLSDHPNPAARDRPPSHLGHRPRQHSQGFFEPSLPTASSSNVSNMSNLTASQIAAQAAMHAQSHDTQHHRKRSTTVPESASPANAPPARRKPSSPGPTVPLLSLGVGSVQQYQNGLPGSQQGAATAAASMVFPKSPLASPAVGQFASSRPMSPAVTGDVKPVKEKSKMKLFSKPKSIGISKDKEKEDKDKRAPSLPSPNRPGMYSSPSLSKLVNQSTTSLVDPNHSAASLYSTANASTSTLVPADKATTSVEKEKEKHRHHFLSRQKHKLKDDHHHLPLSSASSNSKPTDPNAPQPLYNFAAPNSPGHSTSFAQSMTGLDLRHGGRGLRQKKKEEKEAKSHATSTETMEPTYRRGDASIEIDRTDWPSATALSTSAPTQGLLSASLALDTPLTSVANLGSIFGLPGMTPDDAWPLIKARVLLIFEGEDPRPPVEDFNALVSIHLRRCIQRQAPIIIIEDLAELLQTGFGSLDQTLRHVPDDRLVPRLVDMWTVVLCTILPFMQAVFLPLDMEFKGRGIMNPKEAAGFWGATLPNRSRADSDEGLSRCKSIPTMGEELDVRRLTLLAFRDTVILPRNDALMAIFSRLSLENINVGLSDSQTSSDAPSFSHASSAPPRPGTSTSLGDSGWPNSSSHSHNSASNILESTSSSYSQTFSSNSRSRATSNTSAGSFHSLPSTVHHHGHQQLQQQQPRAATPATASTSQQATGLPRPQPRVDTAKVMETVARMLQCVSILISIRSGDEAQALMERLAAELKYNWFGRGRTGRNRRGFVGRKGTVGVGLGALGVGGPPPGVRVGEGM